MVGCVIVDFANILWLEIIFQIFCEIENTICDVLIDFVHLGTRLWI